MRVLVIEDQEDNRIILRDRSRRAGHEVPEAADGIARIEAALRDRPDIILMNMQLPEMDGHEATR